MIDRRRGKSNSPTVFLETFGCQMNVLDSELVTSQLLGLGYRFIDDWQQADVVLYNTCSVRQQAENKVYSRIGLFGRHKQRHPHVVLGVIGCMAERDGEDMPRRYPQIDLLCGPGELDKLPLLIDNTLRTALESGPNGKRVQAAVAGNNHRRTATLSAAQDQLESLDLARSFSPDDHHGSAYVRITRGCNKFCTYCVVPNTRGGEVHRPPDNILEECSRLVDAGICEITLLGQTVNHYRFRHGAAVTINGVQQPQIGAPVNNSEPVGLTSDRTTTFADLLARIHDTLPDLPRLRFVTSFPRDFGDDILQVMRDRPRICRYLHLPVQSASNRILKLMNRGYTIEQYEDLLARIREQLPDALVASDIICGFPTETESEHQSTCGLLRRGHFKNCFIFKYSPRPGTAAFDRLHDGVPHDVKRRRNNELLAIQSQISADIHARYVGTTQRVFVESVSEKASRSANTADPTVTLSWQQPRTVTQLSGRTAGDLIVMFDADPSLVGAIVDVRIKRSAPLALFGDLVTAPTKTILEPQHAPDF